jgi:hypothetical protein
MIQEGFKPLSNTPPDTLLNKLKFWARLVLDFQTNTVYRHLQEFLPKMQGKVLDIGCGQSPYKDLLNSQKTQYYGLDIEEANQKFNYENKVILALIVFPFFVLSIFVGHLSLVFGLGSKDDPLGYTIWLKK